VDNVNLVHEEVIKMPYKAGYRQTKKDKLRGTQTTRRSAKQRSIKKRSGVKGAKGILKGIAKAASRMGTPGMTAGAGGLKGKARKGKPTKPTMKPKPKPKKRYGRGY
jgi:hypothetical protein